MTTTRSAGRLGRALMLGATVVLTLGIGLLPAGAAGAATRPRTTPTSPSAYAAIGAAARLPVGDRTIGRMPAGRMLRVDVVLQPRDPEQLTQYATAVASPHSNLYRHYLSPKSFRQTFAPSAASRNRVEAQLRSDGLNVLRISTDGLVIPVEATSSRIEAAFGTSIDVVRLSNGRLGQWAVSAPRLPARLAPSVLAILGLDDLVTPEPFVKAPAAPAARPRTLSRTKSSSVAKPSATGAPKACAAASAAAVQGNASTDDQVAHAYGMTGLYSKGILGAGQTVALFEEDVYATSDLRTFDKCYLGADHTNQVSLINIDGGEPAGFGGGEATLDVEDVSAYAPAAHIEVYDAPPDFIGWVDEMAAIVNQDTANVVNVSYGICETQMAEAAPGLMQTENVLFEEAALQGQTFVVASGDSGSETCFANDDSNTSLSVSDPTSQPFVTSVGGTSLKTATFPPVETVWNDGGSGAIGGFGENGAGGGGISQMWTMPSWQASATIPGVLNRYSTGSLCGAPAGSNCREVPDVSASADELHGDTVVYGGQWTTIGGTSAAAPKWVALLALTNNYCASLKLGPVGFVTPALYQIASNPVTFAEAFNDITKGNNDVLGSAHGAYPATRGYDLASGLGSPRVTGPNGSAGLASLLCSDGSSDASHPTLTAISPDHGTYTGGTAVTLTGTNLAGVTRAQFGPVSVAVKASDITDGGTTISIDSPPSPTQPFDGGTPVGGVLVAVSGSKGTSPPSLHAEFHYLAGTDASPKPSVDFVSPSSAAAGTTIAIYGSGFAEGLGAATAPTVKFGGVTATGVTVVSDTELTATIPAQSGATDCVTADEGVPVSNLCQVEVTVTNSFGTSAVEGILPPPTGLVFDLFIPVAGTENVPAVTEFDYAAAPVISTVSPDPVGLAPTEFFSQDPFTPDIVTITGTGFNYFSLEAVEATVPGQAALDQSLFVGIITPTTVEFDAPVFENEGGPIPPERAASPESAVTPRLPADAPPPTTFNLSVKSSAGPSNVVPVAIAPTNITVSTLSRHDGSTSGGETVTVTGTHLNAASGILYAGGFPLGATGTTTNFTVLSPTKLTFVTPGMPAEAGVFEVCDASVCADSPDTQFQYFEPVQPVVTGISPSSGSAGGGEPVTITGSGLGSVTAVKFGSSETTNVSNPFIGLGTSTTSVTAVAAPGVIGTRVTITVVTLAGTSPPAHVFFTYHKGAPGPPVDVSVKPAPGAGFVSWMPPRNNGGSPIVGYSVSAHAEGGDPFGPTPTSYIPAASLPAGARHVLLPVSPGVAWVFEVKAVTALGSRTAIAPRVIEVSIGDDGYAIAGADGTVLGYGDLGGLPPGGGGTHKKSPIVALAVTPDAAGYFTVAADGHVSAFGTAKSSGSLLPQRHTTPVVDLVVDANERGYWIITAGGGVFAFGHAPNHGHISHSPTSPIVSAAGTADGGGYWLANAAGNVFAFGDAKKSGSLIGRHFSGSVVAIMASPFGGYWLVTSNGHLYGFGAAAQLKSPTSVSSPIVSATPTPDGAGCWLFESNGSVVAVGDAHFEGDPHGTLESRAVAISA